MSFFQTEKVACPSCQADVEFDVVYSVNAVARPDLRLGILDGTFQARSCPECALTFRVDPEFTYLDAKNKQWILARPYADRGEWPSMELYAKTFYDAAFGPDAPPTAQRIGRGMTCRIAFGWNALREKIIAHDRGLDDISLELTKLALMRSLEGAPFGDGIEFRLVDSSDTELLFAWYEAESEKFLESVRIPRQAYTDIAEDKAGWMELRTEISAGPMVDVIRLWAETTDPKPEAPATA